MRKILISFFCVIILSLNFVGALTAAQDNSSPREFNQHSRLQGSGSGSDWELIDTITETVQIDAGERFYINFDNETDQLNAIAPFDLPDECDQAINRVPEWLKDNLTYKFRQLSPSNRVTYANLILNSPDNLYIDEIAFCIAHSSVEALENQYFFPQLLTQNAQLIYLNDVYLSYVDIVEKADYTTISYKNKTGVSHEVPRDIYYWNVVHPKLSDELATYVDPDYNYDTQAPGSRNYGVAPPTGKFWREWFFYYNDTGQNYTYPGTNNSKYKPNPLLKDLLTNCTTVWEAVAACSLWVVDSMIFSSDDERPIQPVRIYQKHMGRCGEHQDIACAAARTALIPTVCTLNSAEDHVWNEFWDQRWVHWDANSKNNVDRKGSHDKDYNGGKDISSVWNCRGDGHIISVTNDYTPTCTFTATVLDSDGLPVDGAEILVGTQNYYDPNYLTITTWGSTDYTGKCKFELGNERDYWSSADTESLGEDPTDSSGDEQLTRVVTSSVTGNSYSHTFDLPNSASSLDVFDTVLPEKTLGKYKMEVSYRVENNILQGVNFYSREHFDYFGPGGNIDFFIADSTNFTEYKNSNPFSAFEFDERGNFNDSSLILPNDENWYVVLSNEFSQRTTKIVNISVSIYGTLIANIITPEEDQELDLDSVITIKGTTFSPLAVTSVEIDIDNAEKWQRASDTTTGAGALWSTWKFEWDTQGLSPGMHSISVKASDAKRTFIKSINVTLLDVTAPMIIIDQPLYNSSFKIGEVISVSGFAVDNVGITGLEFELNEVTEERIDLLPNYQNEEWSYELFTDELLEGEYTITIHTEDLANNYDNLSVPIIILENIDPVVLIAGPLNNSIHRLGSPIDIGGKVTDNSKVTLLEIIIDDYEPVDITSSISKSGYWGYQWDTEDMNAQEGEHIIEVIAHDAANNNGSAKIYISLDGTPPTIKISKPLDFEIYSADDELVLKGMAYDNYGINSMEVIIDSENPSIIPVDFEYLNWTYKDLSTRRLTSGEHTITIRATDQMGFNSEDSVIILIDASEPVAKLTQLENAVLIGNTVTFEGSANDDIGISVLELDIADMVTIDISSEFNNITGTWSYLWNASGMVEGEYDVTLMVTDVVGKQSMDKIKINLISYNTDTDSDGMPDWWELLFDRLDPNIDDARFDFDRDSFTNLEEYLGDDGLPDNDDYSDPADKSSIPHLKDEKSTDRTGDYTYIWVALIVAIIIIILLLVFMILKKKRDEEPGTTEVEKTTFPPKQDSGDLSVQAPTQTAMPIPPGHIMAKPGFGLRMGPGQDTIYRPMPIMYPPNMPAPLPKTQTPTLKSQTAQGLSLPPASGEISTKLKEPEIEPDDEHQADSAEDENGYEDPMLFLTKSLLESAIEKIKIATEKGVDIDPAKELLLEVQKAMDDQDFDKAMEFAGKCKEEAERILNN